MKTSSAKAKGRRLQQQVVKDLQKHLNLGEADIKSTPMGTQGVDVWLSSEAQKKFPFALECKNTERLNIWAVLEQATANAGDNKEMIVFSKNRSPKYVVLDWETFLTIYFREK